ncbi:phosphatase PAP2 family protein [Actinokineospora sp. PR83]|uniref:phosphatase PAP2 family protein n=1 Tax=Actinokineospora sp. PR83 TaxID=2884908 RepID=UPI0027E10FAB|nr:phosphatase PAP2 family protein [Actinokineospora sp. PR83]MCG8916859.1 phosphatase PAP2 family protein [Actinokineospora sp. PR83]
MRWLLGVGLLLVAAFVALGLTVSGVTPGVDRFVAEALGGGFAGDVGSVASVLSDVFGPVLPIAMGAGLLVRAAVVRTTDRDRSRLLLKAVVVLVLCRVVSFVKPLFARARPREYPDFSFPSGHVTSVAAVAFTAAVLCAWLARPRLRACAFWGGLAVLVAALCRILLDVHWLTDTVGAVVGVLGVGLLASAALGLLPPPAGEAGSRPGP